MTTEQPIPLDINDRGIRWQARRILDTGAQFANSDETFTSRPDAVPTWDDLTKDEQDEAIKQYADDGSLWDWHDVPWFGSEHAEIGAESNPWLKDEDGESIDLTDLFNEPRIIIAGGCEQCGNGPVPGVLPAMDTPYGIQRCDTCGIYEGDLQAARALRDELYPDATVWFYGTN